MRKFLPFLIAVSLIAISCNKKEPVKLNTIQKVEQYVSETEFSIDEYTDTSNSSWINSERYQSEDGESSFFTMTTNEKDYISVNVPIEVWQGFKNADSKGSFYNKNRRDKYTIR